METLKFVMTAAFYPPYHLGGDANHVRYLAEAWWRKATRFTWNTRPRPWP